MSRLEAVANVALRVPALALLDLLYRWDAAAIAELLRPRRGDPPLLRPPALRGASCLGRDRGQAGDTGDTPGDPWTGDTPGLDRLGTPQGQTGWGREGAS